MEHHSANPMPGGIVSFSVACYAFAGVFGGFVGADGLFLLGCWLFGAWVVQLITANKELDHGVQLGGNVFLFFQGFFCLTGAIGSMYKYLCLFVWNTSYNTTVEGFGWLACTLALIMWTPIYLKTANKVWSSTVVITDIALVIVILNDFYLLTGPIGAILKPVAAICLALAGTLALYVAAAIQYNTIFGKTVLPLGDPWIKAKD